MAEMRRIGFFWSVLPIYSSIADKLAAESTPLNGYLDMEIEIR